MERAANTQLCARLFGLCTQKDSLRASCTRRGLFTVDWTKPNPGELTSFTGIPNCA